MTSSVIIKRYGPIDYKEIVEILADLYESDFVEEAIKKANPDFYSRQRFLDRMADYAASPEFETVVGFEGSRVVGFVSAANLIPNTRWWKVVDPPLSESVTREDNKRTVAIFDLLVERSRRGKGIGETLHTELLAQRQEERATLLSGPDQQPAHSIWLHWGYQIVSQASPSKNGPELDVFLRNLPLK